jgi:large conductance mechanosensitive channel
MKILQEFREFAVKGNVVDLAVGVVLGAAFGKVVSTLVDAILMPPLGLVIGGVDFSHLSVVLRDAVAGKPAVTWKYGVFLQSVFDFILVAIAVFALIKVVNRLKRTALTPEAIAAAPPASAEVVLLTEIRDLLAKKP